MVHSQGTPCRNKLLVEFVDQRCDELNQRVERHGCDRCGRSKQKAAFRNISIAHHVAKGGPNTTPTAVSEDRVANMTTNGKT